MANPLYRTFLKIFIVVSLYWFVSIAMVFLNKKALNHLNAPFFITWFQCVFTVFLLATFRIITNMYSNYFDDSMKFGAVCPQPVGVIEVLRKHLIIPTIYVRLAVIKKILPLSMIFVGMISFNNLSLHFVGVSFYFIARSLTPVFNVIFTYVLLHKSTSLRSLLCCFGIICGFGMGVDEEQEVVSIYGVVCGITASLFVSLNSIFVADILAVVDNNVSLLSYYNSMIATVLFIPLMLLNGELSTVFSRTSLPIDDSDSIFGSHFSFLMVLTGVFGMLISIVTNLQIKHTSPLTHNISGTAKACTQTVLATFIYNEHKSFNWWISNFMVLISSALYTYVRQQELRSIFQPTALKQLNIDDESDRDVEDNELINNGQSIKPFQTSVTIEKAPVTAKSDD